MNYARKTYFFIVLASIMWSCGNDQLQAPIASVNDQVLIYQELVNMEYALLISDYKQVKDHSSNLDDLLKEGYNLFCPEESSKIDGARLTNQILIQHIQNNENSKLSDDLRILKATIINLATDEDYDPYFLFLWRFEEDMDAATEVAIDPMLNLYEWNEFNDMVDCMNVSWQSVKMHRPSPDILNNDPEKYKNQSVHKIYLEQSIDNFNMAISQVDNLQYPLCEMAEGVREAYLEYIYTFNMYQIKDDTFLAKL